MAPAVVTYKYVLALWTPMNAMKSRVRVGKVKFDVGQHVRISKEKNEIRKGVRSKLH